MHVTTEGDDFNHYVELGSLTYNNVFHKKLS